MPHAKVQGVNKVAASTNSEAINTTSYLAGDATEILETEGSEQVEKIRAAGVEDDQMGIQAFNTLQQIQNIDNLLLKRLGAFYQTLAAGQSINEEHLLTVG